MSFSSIRLIPFLVIVVLVAFSVRLADVVVGVSNLTSTAVAASPKEEDKGHAKDKAKKDMAEEKMAKAEKHGKKEGAEPKSKWRDANDVGGNMEDVKIEMFKDLSKRRDELEKTEKDLRVREALLKAASKEVDKKIQELNKLRVEIEGLLNKQSEEEEGRIKSLVKIYEGMKPKDAARIFDTLDIDVLVAVISKMSERKIAPVMAAMNPERARSITIMLAEQKQLPSL